MSQKDVGNKIPIYKLKTTKEVMDFYDEWGNEDKYNKDMVDWDYSGPKETVSIFKKYAENKDMLIFDAGCGTGLVGKELQKFGYNNFHGADLSKTLLNTIPKNLYKKLDKVDLNQPIKISDNYYDAVMCVGTFTYAHVKADALDEFVRITKNEGLICFTINEGIYKEYGFDIKIKELENKKKWKKIKFFKSDYIASKEVNAWLGLYEVIK
ncbi:class I SAM-dependent methyltransferase [Candidatus Pelagibacter sp.]|nr:class I SAM-dependent methyltransferase [Candidatus Pelagibacter sp.]